MTYAAPRCPTCGNSDRTLMHYWKGVYTCQSSATSREELAALEEAGYDMVGGICSTQFSRTPDGEMYTTASGILRD